MPRPRLFSCARKTTTASPADELRKKFWRISLSFFPALPYSLLFATGWRDTAQLALILRTHFSLLKEFACLWPRYQSLWTLFASISSDFCASLSLKAAERGSWSLFAH
jgi:hypothetical protein